MKTKIQYLFAIVLLTFTLSFSFAQKSYVIKYEMVYDAPGLDAAMKAQLPSEMTMYIKGNKMMQESKSSMGTQSAIYDGDTKSSIVLIDMMGQQLAIKVGKEEIEKQLTEMPKVTVDLFDETKKIAGYTCKKAEITEGDNTFTVFYTSDLGVSDINWATEFKDIKGVMMEYSTSQQEMTVKFTAKEVKEQKIKDKQFTIPSGYKELTPEEAKKMFGGE
ncbi:MAG: hypothetical protein A2275_11425 [Bacteroidetes bacterium RIFOXYA12_FULL_35_11]|nr:MAG: hypothetical protein A2X01_00485 [Bacteroidetes bacterium GWF2_35_48]OFY79873.1 MAG: hypothetical protein A2275_11425 [Bacteroidetes bacterium RIFOXYA12_FULL_35_11]OFY94850.1 MAG: hypothetical protein A2309_13975 [Bacteroidetes bacterium RIFOXYB2_FULL_35_7]OFY96862.1 MAG: hypothetical protein A2491_06650 [Bacteroidetes bacterium RIFOXYC12_FULL_35_7]HBX49643.1 hypothetical protein [Bacteroidales bacterium]